MKRKSKPDRGYRLAFAALMLLVLAMFWRHVFTPGVPYVRDIALEHFPRSMELRALVRSGSLPIWNPFEHCGEPVASNPIYLLFYPSSWLAWILPPVFGFKIHYVLHFFLLAAGGFLLARRSGLSPFACWTAGALLVFSGPAASLGNFYNMLPAVAWMPFVVLAADFMMRAGRWRGAGAFAAAITMQFFAGEPATSFASFTLALGWCAAHYADFRGPLASDANRLLLRRFAGGALLAVPLAAAQLFPLLHQLPTTGRAGRMAFQAAAFWSLHPLKILELLVPGIWGNWLTHAGLPWLYLDGREPFLLSVFIGIVPVALALVAVLAIPGSTVRFWGIVAAVFLLLALGAYTPIFNAFYYGIPVFRVVRFPAKMLLPATLALTQLAALGLDFLLSGRAAPRLRWLSRALLAFGALWLAASAAVLTGAGRKAVAWLVQLHFDHVEAQRLLLMIELPHGEIVARAVGWIRAAPPQRAPYVWLAVMVAAAILHQRRVAGGAHAYFVGERARRILVIMAALGSVAVLMFVHASVNPVVDPRFFRNVPPVTQYFAGPKPVRIFAEPPFRPANSLLSLAAEGASLDFLPPPAQVLYSYRMSLQTGATLLGLETAFSTDPQVLMQQPLAEMNWVIYDQHLKGPALTRVLRLSSVQYALFTVPVPAPGLQALGTAPNGTRAPVTAYQVPNPMPRAYLAEEALQAVSGRVALETMIHDEFDPARQVVLAEPAPMPATAASDPERRAHIVRRDPARVEIETSSTAPAYLVLTDSFNSDWRATVDGNPARVLRANHIFRAVALPAGTHRVVFRFVPLWLYVGVAVTLLSALVTAFACASRYAFFNPSSTPRM